MTERVTYRRRHPYKTKSNRTRLVRTPGGRLVVQYVKKKVNNPRCRISGLKLQGLKAYRPAALSCKRLSKRHKTVSRKYGGCLSHGVVRERIVRAFLLEEQKIVRKVLKLQRVREGQ
ncbi:hypothetical protein BSKO_01030 [Bryopsis sp. KO-2023]|nr:hypothetical protein BSKO_01030 [Bryopsis sp. KO-2023]